MEKRGIFYIFFKFNRGNRELKVVQCCVSGSGRLRIQITSWIRIRYTDPDPASENERFSWFSPYLKMILIHFPCLIGTMVQKNRCLPGSVLQKNTNNCPVNSWLSVKSSKSYKYLSVNGFSNALWGRYSVGTELSLSKMTISSSG